MPLSIKDPEADRLARAVAAHTGETITQAVITALRERLAREERRAQNLDTLVDEVMKIGRHCAALPLHPGRQQLKAKYGDVYGEVVAILYQHDPIGLSGAGAPEDEYEPEAGTILPRLGEARSVADARHIIHEEFVHWFDAALAGPATDYAQIADDVWAAWERYASQQGGKA